MICTSENILSFQCGLNPLGSGNFFITLSTKQGQKSKQFRAQKKTHKAVWRKKLLRFYKTIC